MNARFAVAACLVALAACGPQREEDLVTDGEIAQVRNALTTAAAPQVAPAPGAPSTGSGPGFHLKLAWGYLAGNWRPPGWVSWNGGLKVDSGTATLEHLIFFEKRDVQVPAEDPREVKWRSRTLPHFDGVVVRVQPGAATDKVHVSTPLFTVDFSAADLLAGVEERFDVDQVGHQVSVSSIPDTGCGGFAFGFLKKAREGWLGFGGILTDAGGAPQGVLRFRAERGQISARLIGRDGAVLDEGEGTLMDGAFSLTLAKLGEVKGIFEGPSTSPRGSFQGTLSCP